MPIIGATSSRLVRMPAAASASSQLSMRAPTVSTRVPSRSNAMPAGAGSWSGGCRMGARDRARLLGVTGEQHTRVVAAEAHRVRERDVHLHLARIVRHVVEVALGVG